MSDSAVALAPSITDPRQLALLKAVGLDRVNPEQRELALNIAQRYELDLLLKHLVMIDGRPYITRDGLLHVAHRSQQLDGIETTDPVLTDGFWRASCSVYRKDMSRPFTYAGRYPEKGQNAKFGPEMAVKVAEVMALRRAFDVAAPVIEERWDMDVPVVEPTPKQSLAEKAAAKAAEVAEPAKGLSKRAFVDALAKNNIPPEYAMAVRGTMFPDTMMELTNAQRGELLDELTRDLTPAEPREAESVPLPIELDPEERLLVGGDLK